MWTLLVVFTYETPVSGWGAAPPECAPPVLEGRMSVPRKLGGVNIGPIRNFFMCSSARALISGVRSFASSRVTPCGVKAGGLAGNGWVGQGFSPDTSVDVSTGRSWIGHTG